MRSVRRFKTASAEETIALGRSIAGWLPPSGVVLLSGELGAGKTTLSKGIVEGREAGSGDEVASPTFALIHEYGDPVRVYHVDLYRLETSEEARRLGLEELIERPALVLVEWGERFPELWPKEPPAVHLQHAGEEARHIQLWL